MKKSVLKNQIIKNILSVLAVVGLGFILLGLTFLFDYLFQTVINKFVVLFITTSDIDMGLPWYPIMKHAMFLVVICLISWFVFKSKLDTLYKAIFMTVPLAVIFATIGIFFYPWPFAVYLIGILFGASVLYYFYRTEQPWLYYYTLILIGITMLLVVLLGIEI